MFGHAIAGFAQSASDEQAIRTLMAKTTDAFNEHDAKAWAAVCTPDARLVAVRRGAATAHRAEHPRCGQRGRRVEDHRVS
jgi:ketosteroid isomerase-like protein